MNEIPMRDHVVRCHESPGGHVNRAPLLRIAIPIMGGGGSLSLKLGESRLWTESLGRICVAATWVEGLNPENLI